MSFAHRPVVPFVVLRAARPVVAALSVSVIPFAHGADPAICVEDAFVAVDADALDGFGERFDVDDESIVVGAWNDEETAFPVSGFSFGSAYVMRRDASGAWVPEQKLLPSDPESEKRFGCDVAIDGDTVLVGALGDSGYTGAAYFYTRVGGVWTGEQKVVGQSTLIDDQFGHAVAIDGDRAVICAPGHDAGCGIGCNPGAIYVFRNVGGTWIEEQKLQPIDPSSQEQFGKALDIQGTMIVATSRVDSDIDQSTGAVWVFEYIGGMWVETQKVYASDATYGDLFGHSVALHDDVMVVGAIHDDDACPSDPLCNSGSAYVFRRSGGAWIEEQKLTSAASAPNDQYGHAVGAGPGVVLVGTRYADDACAGDPECNSGSGYLYSFDGAGWRFDGALRADDGALRDQLGTELAVVGDQILVGCYGDDAAANGAGSIYVFDPSGDACACPADLDENGAVDFTDLVTVLAAWGVVGDPADLDGSGVVDFGDVLALLAQWGPC